ncbi:MAG: hypothetical protein M5U12_09365 [Verrucomicrobia bacterium]|nr:hypothetical protein [Verrucomicrobiota bacterium]
MKFIVPSQLAWLPAVPPLLAQVTWDTGSPSTYLPATTTGTVTDFQHGPGILGGERESVFEVLSAPFPSFGNTMQAYPGYGLDGTTFLGASRGINVLARCTWVWDGIDGSPTINPTGLGNVDLAAAFSGIEFDLSMDENGGTWSFRFYTDASNYSTYHVSIPSGTLISGTHYSLGFSDFLPTGAGADFSRIGAIVITSEGGAGMDTELDNLRFTPVPEPRQVAWVTGWALVTWRAARGRRPADAT